MKFNNYNIIREYGDICLAIRILLKEYPKLSKIQIVNVLSNLNNKSNKILWNRKNLQNQWLETKCYYTAKKAA